MAKILKNKYPQSPSEWNDANNYLYRNFTFRSYPDIEILQRLVRENIPDRGNNSYLRARLLGILGSMYSRSLKYYFTKRDHPKTWRIRLAYGNLRRWLHRKLRTKHFTYQVMLCNIAREVCDEHEQNKKS